MSPSGLEAVSAPAAAAAAASATPSADDDFGSQGAAACAPAASADAAGFLSAAAHPTLRPPMRRDPLAETERAAGTTPRVTAAAAAVARVPAAAACGPYPSQCETRTTGSLPQYVDPQHTRTPQGEQGQQAQEEPPLQRRQPRSSATCGASVAGPCSAEAPFPIPPLPTPLPFAAAAAGGVQGGGGQRSCCSCRLRPWLRRTFPPIVLVTGTAAAKREVAALTGLTLASLFQPFNGEALAARLVAAPAAAAEHRKRQELQQFTAQRKKKQQQQREELPSQQAKQDPGKLLWRAECSEDEFLSREGYHPSHVYRYGLLNAGSGSSSKTGSALSRSGSSGVQQGSCDFLPSSYIRDIPPLNLLLHAPASSSTRCAGAASDAVASGPTTGAGTSSSSLAHGSSSGITSLSTTTGGSSDAGDGAGFLPSAAAPGSAEPAPASGSTTTTTTTTNTPQHCCNRRSGSNDYFCVRFIDLEDAESPSPLAADALAMRALTQAPPPLQDLSTFTAAAASSSGTPSSSAAAHSRHSSVSPPYSPSPRALRPTQASAACSAASSALVDGYRPAAAADADPAAADPAATDPAAADPSATDPAATDPAATDPAAAGAAATDPAAADAAATDPAAADPAAADAAAVADVRRSGVRSSASSPFVYPAEGSCGVVEAAASCQPIASASGCRGTDLLWYEEWERVLFESLRFSEHETLSQPVGLVLVASSRDADPAQELQQLLQPHRLPSLCSRFVLDPNPVRAFVLLDIHPNALQARAELTSACLLRRRRFSTQQRQQSSGKQTRQQRLLQPHQQQQEAESPSRAASPAGSLPPPLRSAGGLCSRAGDGGAAAAAGRAAAGGEEGEGEGGGLEASDGSLPPTSRAACDDEERAQLLADSPTENSLSADAATSKKTSPAGPAPAAEGATLLQRSRLPQSHGGTGETPPSIISHDVREGEQEGGGGPAFAAQWHQQQRGSSRGVQQVEPAKPGHSAAAENPSVPRGEALLEQLCAAFPPANCHLLTLGRATDSPAHWQLLPAIRFLYAQSLTPNFSSTLSAGRTPVMLSGSQNVNAPQVLPHPSPPPFLPLRPPVDTGSSSSKGRRSWGGSSDRSEGVAVPGEAGDAKKKNAEEEAAAAAAVAATAAGVVLAADVDWLLCSGYQLPVASRLTLPAAMSSLGGGNSPAQPAARAPQMRGAVTVDPVAAAAAALSSIENSFCVGLSWADLHALSAFVQHLVHTGILPWVERKTQQLETAISSSRRGFRNQLRYLWRKPKASAAAASAFSPAGGPGGSVAAAALAGLSSAATLRTGRSGGVVASAAEQATGAAEAILSVVGGALLGDAASSLYSSTSLLHLGGGSSKSQQQLAKNSCGGLAGGLSPEKSQISGELNTLKSRGTAAAAKTTGNTVSTTGVAAGATPPPTAYQLHTVEWQYRLQADLYFFMGNFEAALQSLRCCSADFKQDKRWMQLGGAYEMQALCLYLTGGSRREIDVCIEHGYNAFVKAAAGRLALRCVLLGLRITMEMVAAALPLPLPWNPLSPLLPLRQRVQQLPPSAAASAAAAESAALEAARQLLAANVDLPALDTQAAEATLTPPSSQQDAAASSGICADAHADPSKGGTEFLPVPSAPGAPVSGAAASQNRAQQQQQQAAAVAFRAQSWAIRSAMLLEQAALCHEQAGLAHRRKRNFQLVMAGHTYYKAGYKRLALRCYTAVVSQYEWCGWQHVAQHLRFIMARQAFSLHLLLDAVFHFAALLDAVACVHHIRRLVCGALPSMSQKRAALQDDNSSCFSSVSASSSSWPSAASSLSFACPPAAAAGSHATRVATAEPAAAETAAFSSSQGTNGVVPSSGAPAASLGLPEVSAERETHYVREFVFVCRVILERQKQQLEQQQHAARALRRGAAGGTENEQQLHGLLSDAAAGSTSSAGGLSSAKTLRGEATAAANTAAAPSDGQTSAAAAMAGDAGLSKQSAAASAGRTGGALGSKADPAGPSPATPTLTLPVGLRVPYVECCNKQGLFRDAIEVRLQGDAAISSEKRWPCNDRHSCSAFVPESAPTESAEDFASRIKEVWTPEELLQLLEATKRSSGAVPPLPVARLCELAQSLLPQQQGASVGRPKLLFAEQQELQLQENFLNEASEAWVETQLEAALRRLSSAAASAGENAASAAETADYAQGMHQRPRGSLESGEFLPAGEASTFSDVEMQTDFPAVKVNDDDVWLLSQLRLERSRAGGVPGDPREGKGSSSRSSSAIYEQLTRRMPVGSPVHVLVCLVNPLQLPLECRNVRLVGSIHAAVPSAGGAAAAAAPAAAPALPADARVAGGVSAPRGAPQQFRQQRRTKKLIEFPAISTVMLAPLETVCLRLVAVPLVQGKLRIRGLSLDLFGFIRLTQPFCLHGSLRQERQYNLRHCRLFSEDAGGSARGLTDSAKGPPGGDRQGDSLSSASNRVAGEAAEDWRQQPLPCGSGSGQRPPLGLWHTGRRDCLAWELEEEGPDGGMPLSFILRAENYKLLPTGMPVEAIRWRFRQRALEIHREDCRLQLLVDDTLPLLSFSFLGWPDAGTPSQPLHQLQATLQSSAAPSSAGGASVLATPAGQGWGEPLAAGEQAAVAARSGSSPPVEKREVPSSNSVPPSYQPLLSSGAAATPASDAPSLAALSPAAAVGAASADASARQCPAVGGAARQCVCTWPRREHLFVGERSTCVLQLSLARRSQPLQALSLAVSPATVVRFQSAVLLLPRDQLQQKHLHRNTACSEKCNHESYGGEFVRGISEGCKEAASTATADAGDPHFLAKAPDGWQQPDEGQILPLLLQEETPAGSSETGGQQALPLVNTRFPPAGPGPGAAAAVHTSPSAGQCTPARAGQRRDGLHRAANDYASQEVDGAGVHIVHVLRPAVAGASAAGTAAAAASGVRVSANAENGEKCEELMAGGSTVQVQLVLLALQPGIQRVRFCVKAVPAAAAEDANAAKEPVHQQQQHRRGLLRKGRSSTLWRGIEKVLVVRASLQLTVEPRLSWKRPNRHLLLCRVKNLSSATFCIENMAALLPCNTSQSEGATAVACANLCCQCGSPHAAGAQSPCSISDASAASLQKPHGKQTRGCEVTVVTLLPCSSRQHDPVIGPYETLHLLYAAKQQEQQGREWTHEFEGSQKKQQLQQQQLGMWHSPQAVGPAAEDGPRTACSPVDPDEARAERSGTASSEAEDILDSALCAGTTIQVGLGWRLAVSNATAAERGEEDRPGLQQLRRPAFAEARLSAARPAAKDSLPALPSSTLREDHCLRAIPRGLVFATSPVELSPRLSYVPLRMQVIVSSPTHNSQQRTPKSREVSAAERATADTAMSRNAPETDALLDDLRQLSPGLTHSYPPRGCCMRRVRFLLQNTSSSLSLRLQLVADLEAAAHALPLRLCAGAAGSTAVLSSPWDSQYPYSIASSISSGRTTLSSTTGAISTSAICSADGEPRLQSPPEDAAANKHIASHRSSDGGSTSSMVVPTGGAGAGGGSSIPSPGRFAAALIHRLPLAPSNAATASASSVGAFGGAGGNSGTNTAGASGTGAVGLGAPLLQFLAPPSAAPQVRATVEALHQQTAAEFTNSRASSLSSELHLQHQELLSGSKLYAAAGAVLHSAGCNAEETVARALIQQFRRQPQCCALPAVGSSVERSLDGVSLPAASFRADDKTPSVRVNDTADITDYSQQPLKGETAASTILYSAVGMTPWKSVAASLDTGGAVEELQLQPLGMEAFDVRGIVPEVVDLSCSSSSSFDVGSSGGIPSAPNGSAQRTRDQAWSAVQKTSDADAIFCASSERQDKEVASEEVPRAQHTKDQGSSYPGGDRGCCNGFYWIGKPEQHLGCVGPGQKVEASLLAFFPSSGVFNVNKVYVRVGVAGQVLSRTTGSSHSTAAVPSTTCQQNENPLLQPQPATDRLCRGGAAKASLVGTEAPSTAAASCGDPVRGPAPCDASQVCNSNRTNVRRDKRFVLDESFFCNTLTRAELQWEAKLARTGCEAVVGFPMECPVYIQPAADGTGAR